ncbi:hypothetical protein [uncultured Megasphaera sp.]|uniref:hypothetical protein n=1 Tax=uncultured Megasphaera sp. TaxID=165188 RepID=UPI0025F5EE11|nr:hypothetical protein [uncultured Megasphaera sp.]
MEIIRSKAIWLKTLITLCLMVIISTSVVLANTQDSRWKWCNSTDHYSMYYDTQTLKYDEANQAVKVWIKVENEKGEITSELLTLISYRDKTETTLQSYLFKNGYPRPFNRGINVTNPIVPDSSIELLANKVGAQFNLKPVYPGGPNRWKWVYSTSNQTISIATDCERYDSSSNTHTVWVKFTDLNGFHYVTPYYCNFTDETIHSLTGTPTTILPDTKEEYIYNTAKELFDKS